MRHSLAVCSHTQLLLIESEDLPAANELYCRLARHGYVVAPYIVRSRTAALLLLEREDLPAANELYCRLARLYRIALQCVAAQLLLPEREDLLAANELYCRLPRLCGTRRHTT